MTARWSCIEGPTATALLRDGVSVGWIGGPYASVAGHAEIAAEVVEQMNGIVLTREQAGLAFAALHTAMDQIGWANDTPPLYAELEAVALNIVSQLKEPE